MFIFLNQSGRNCSAAHLCPYEIFHINHLQISLKRLSLSSRGSCNLIWVLFHHFPRNQFLLIWNMKQLNRVKFLQPMGFISVLLPAASCFWMFLSLTQKLIISDLRFGSGFNVGPAVTLWIVLKETTSCQAEGTTSCFCLVENNSFSLQDDLQPFWLFYKCSEIPQIEPFMLMLLVLSPYFWFYARRLERTAS